MNVPRPGPRLRVGLTGGIGSGKSTAAACFAALGVPIIDADQLARELVQPDTAALAEIVQTFGTQILDTQGSLDRARLRALVFNDTAQRHRLEAILHPRIRTAMDAATAVLDSAYCIWVIPLLVENGWQHRVDRVLVIDAPEEVQLARVRARDGWTEQDIAAVLNAQASRAQRLAVADDVIVNEGDVARLRVAVRERHRGYVALAGSVPDEA